MRLDIRRFASRLRRTPLHPQWLLGGTEKTGKWVSENAQGHVLDVGCADRWVEGWLAPGCVYLSVDYPVTGKQLYGARPDVFADASQLPLQDASMDTVILLEVLEHLRKPQDALQEIARVLRPQGRLLLSVPFLYPAHDAPHDYQRLTVHGLFRDIEATGLRVEGITPTLGSAETAGLIACLAMGGMAVQAIERRSASLVFVPFLALAIPLINLTAWFVGLALPSWSAITAGYRVRASRR
jgi:SAM-dependent methyltransferase